MEKNKKISKIIFAVNYFYLLLPNKLTKPIHMQTKLKKGTNIFKELSFDGRYNDFTDFYDENKTEIYKSIIELFAEFKVSRKKSLNLQISAKIRGLDWDTEFTFKKDETIILTRDVMPYFENMEDYETCSEIILLKKDLTS